MRIPALQQSSFILNFLVKACICTTYIYCSTNVHRWIYRHSCRKSLKSATHMLLRYCIRSIDPNKKMHNFCTFVEENSYKMLRTHVTQIRSEIRKKWIIYLTLSAFRPYYIAVPSIFLGISARRGCPAPWWMSQHVNERQISIARVDTISSIQPAIIRTLRK